jgi:hypothetical protein
MRTLLVGLLLLTVACGARRGAEAIEAEPEPVPREEREWIPRPHEMGAMAVREIYRGPPPECEMGDVRACFPRGLGPSLNGNGGPFMHCMEMADGSRRFFRGGCDTPLVLSFDDRPVQFIDAEGPFQIGSSAETDWVDARTPWLVLDADGSGCIDDQRELFGGDATTANGFERLARLDDDHNGRIDAADAAYARLALWADRNADRACSPDELVSLASAGVVSIDLAYASAPLPNASGGSYEGEQATFQMTGGKRGRVVDVYLAPTASRSALR